jgi:hypothetical protein
MADGLKYAVRCDTAGFQRGLLITTPIHTWDRPLKHPKEKIVDLWKSQP